MAALDGETSSAEEKSRAIDRALKEDAKVEQRRTKILLLGAGESGKTTILKQVRMMQGNQFTDEEREELKDVLWQNMILCQQAILNAVIDMDLKIIDPTSKKAAQYIHTLELPQDTEVYIEKVAPAIQLLWKDPIVQEAFSRGREYQLLDSSGYLFERVEAMAQPDYIPTDQDMLRARVKTTGIQELHFELQGKPFLLCDVGGQKSERRKWISCFSEVEVLLFVVGTSEFDQTMAEDTDTNRWQDAETLYEATINSRWLTNALLVIFMNKMDLFAAKIKTTRLSDWFADYPKADDHQFAKGTLFLLDRLTKLHRDKERRYYHHATCAVDSKQMKAVLNSVIDNTIVSNLKQSGFLY